MVYGLGTAPVHGYYVNVEMVDGNPSAIRAVNQESDGGVSFRGFTSGRPCVIEHFPSKMRWLDRQGHPIPDFDQAELLNVSERAKTLIESIEPRVHQFVPVDYIDSQDNFIEKRYFWVICNRIDSVDREYTTFVLRKGKAWRAAGDLYDRGEFGEIPDHIDPKIPAKFTFNISRIGNARVWRDKHMDLGDILVSNNFSENLKSSGLTGFKLSEELESV